MSAAAGVTVGKLLQGRPETLRLDLEILAGSGGLDRCITSPYVQKTGLALAGFHEHLRPGRTLVFGNSGVRRRSETILIGTCPELTRHHMEIRGLGVINIRILVQLADLDQLDESEIEEFPDPGEGP